MELITASKSVSGPRPHRSLSVLIIGQVAFACILLIGAGLLTQTFRALENEPLGFNPNNLLTVGLKLPGLKYGDGKEDKLVAFYQQLLEKISALPGVRPLLLTMTCRSAVIVMKNILPSLVSRSRIAKSHPQKHTVCTRLLQDHGNSDFTREALDLSMFWVGRALS